MCRLTYSRRGAERTTKQAMSKRFSGMTHYAEQLALTVGAVWLLSTPLAFAEDELLDLGVDVGIPGSEDLEDLLDSRDMNLIDDLTSGDSPSKKAQESAPNKPPLPPLVETKEIPTPLLPALPDLDTPKKPAPLLPALPDLDTPKKPTSVAAEQPPAPSAPAEAAVALPPPPSAPVTSPPTIKKEKTPPVAEPLPLLSQQPEEPNRPQSPTKKTDTPPPAPALPPASTASHPPSLQTTEPLATTLDPLLTQPPSPTYKPAMPTTSPLFIRDLEALSEDTDVDSGLSRRTRTIFSEMPVTPQGSAHRQYDIQIDRATDTGLLDEVDTLQKASPEGEESDRFSMDMHLKPINKSTETLLEEAYEALISGQAEVAIAIYKKVLKHDTENRLGLFGIATTYHRMGQRKKALKYYENLLHIYPDYQDGINNFLALASEESPEDALREIELLERKNPGYSPIPAQMAMIYKKMGKPREAVVKLSEAVRLSPRNLSYRYNLAILHDQLGDRREAIMIYEQLVDAWRDGATLPGNITSIQERLTFLRNK